VHELAKMALRSCVHDGGGFAETGCSPQSHSSPGRPLFALNLVALRRAPLALHMAFRDITILSGLTRNSCIEEGPASC
jgi:hypothetical protein